MTPISYKKIPIQKYYYLTIVKTTGTQIIEIVIVYLHDCKLKYLVYFYTVRQKKDQLWNKVMVMNV